MTQEESKHISTVYEKEHKALFRFIRGRTGSAADAEDILQDVFFQLTTGFREIRVLGSLTSWLYRVARNRITDYYRKNKPGLLDDFVVAGDEEGEALKLEAVLSSGDDNPEILMEKEEMWDAVFDVLEEMPERQREVFVWHELEDLSFKEMSERTGEGVNTLLSRKRYAILFLKERLKYYKPNK